MTQRSYAWSYEYAEDLVLFDYEIKNIGEHLAHKMLLYKAIFPDDEFKTQIIRINKSLKEISNKISDAVKYIGSDLEESYNFCENVKEERRRMRKGEWTLLDRLWNYDVDYIGRTWYYLKELIEGIILLADHIKNFAEYIQFISTKYLIY